MTTGEVRHCSVCATEQVFEQPPCAEGHDECPEWCCTRCGAAVVLGGAAVVPGGVQASTPASARTAGLPLAG